jgi:hypothetical protein
MKTTTVPAQVTTVEDKIAGSLTLPQLFLLIAPIFVASAIYLIIPPVMHLTIIKCAISFFIWLTGGIMAIRLKDKIVLLWLVVLIHYAVRITSLTKTICTYAGQTMTSNLISRTTRPRMGKSQSLLVA